MADLGANIEAPLRFPAACAPSSRSHDRLKAPHLPRISRIKENCHNRILKYQSVCHLYKASRHRCSPGCLAINPSTSIGIDETAINPEFDDVSFRSLPALRGYSEHVHYRHSYRGSRHRLARPGFQPHKKGRPRRPSQTPTLPSLDQYSCNPGLPSTFTSFGVFIFSSFTDLVSRR